ncbi:hypothetical protein LX32DRAFT_1528 [Colletotrichum zoysiae]|uniref:Uncharacterized protein n=1 Tax=Colletotrichum zoysiae TaxID=1216348 RepID=A0AAD9HUV8_9PEZI|nr:hypothetical protein LX32DRAFT_1528 [Colletotrichum zoysiae]
MSKKEMMHVLLVAKKASRLSVFFLFLFLPPGYAGYTGSFSRVPRLVPRSEPQLHPPP